MKNRRIPLQLAISILLGIVIGCLTPREKMLWFFVPTQIYHVASTLFIHALMMVCIPLVSSSIIIGLVQTRSTDLGRIGGKMFACYLGTTAIAVFIALFIANVMPPQQITNIEHQLFSAGKTIAFEGQYHFADFFLKLIPANIFWAFAHSEMLSIAFFSVLFGYAISTLNSPISNTLQSFFQAIFQAMMRMVHIVLRFLPIGVFFLVAHAFSETGIHSLYHLGLFIGVVLLGLLAFVGIALPILLRFVAGVSPFRHFQAMWPALVTAFSTSSSSATIPVTLECVEKRANVSNGVASLVIPLGTTFNLAGSALYECTAVLFIAHAYGIHLSLTGQLLIVMLSLAMSIGVASIPSGSLVAITAILKAMGLPLEGIGLFIAAERLMDMCRTTVNIFSDSVCAVMVAKFKGEKVLISKVEKEDLTA
jgi:Na+/H+-dicarboxylate symporter